MRIGQSVLERGALVGFLAVVLSTGCPAKDETQHEDDGLVGGPDGEPGVDEGDGAASASESTGETSQGDDEGTTGGDSCIPPIETTIAVAIGTCSDESCEGELGSWAPAGVETGTLSANCTARPGPTLLAGGSKRWVLEGCGGDEIPDNALLAVDWKVMPEVALALPAAEAVQIELHRPRPTMFTLALRSGTDGLLGVRVFDSRPPAADITTPLLVEAASTLCEVPPESCLGPRLIQELRINDGAGNGATFGWGDTQVVGTSPGYAVLVRQAQAFPEIPCGEFSEGGFFDLVVARLAP